MFLRAVAVVLLALGLAACAGAHGPWVELKGQRFIVEIAADPASRQRGLMFRDRLEEGHGMLFIHTSEELQAFWMKNTRIPLDILYFDRQRRLVSVAARVPPCGAGDACPAYPSRGRALYTLEINAGVASTLGVAPGDELILAPGMPAAR